MPNAWEKIEAYAAPSQAINSPKGPFIGVKVEQHERYDIFWFVWDKDGIIPKRIVPQDWEPLILYWRDRNPVRITVRLHYEWVDYSSQNLDAPHFSLPLRVIFGGSNHGALVRKENDLLFDSMIESHGRLEYDYEAIREENVPPFARKGLFNRRGVLVSAGQDIHERALETLAELDEMLGRTE